MSDYAPPSEATLASRREWMLMYKAWREQHLDKTKEWRGRRVRGCFKKQAFDDILAAKKVMANLEPREGVVLNIYRCDLCGRLHLGNSRFRHELYKGHYT